MSFRDIEDDVEDTILMEIIEDTRKFERQAKIPDYFIKTRYKVLSISHSTNCFNSIYIMRSPYLWKKRKHSKAEITVSHE